MVEYFFDLLTEDNAVSPKQEEILEVIPKLTDKNVNASLLAPVSMEEIRVLCSLLKAIRLLVLMDSPTFSFQSPWDIVAVNVLEVVQ